MNTFQPLQAPSAGSGGAEYTARLIKNNFGDGYRQTLADGLNPVDATVPLNWNACTLATRTYILAFLRGNLGKPFYYTLPGETVARKWDCETWKDLPGSGGYWMVSATLKERFDNAT